MKKHTVIFQKQGDISIPVYREQFVEMISDVKDGEYFQGVFSTPKRMKSNQQLGWLYAGIYRFMEVKFKELWGDCLYEIEKNGIVIHCKTNITNIDIMMKQLFCDHKGIQEFNKTGASIDDLTEYINFLDNFSINNFGQCLPEPPKERYYEKPD